MGGRVVVGWGQGDCSGRAANGHSLRSNGRNFREDT